MNPLREYVNDYLNEKKINVSWNVHLFEHESTWLFKTTAKAKLKVKVMLLDRETE